MDMFGVCTWFQWVEFAAGCMLAGWLVSFSISLTSIHPQNIGHQRLHMTISEIGLDENAQQFIRHFFSLYRSLSLSPFSLTLAHSHEDGAEDEWEARKEKG